ncbi:hypothetical protein [Dasineura jujubifolia toursvirus 2a]|nr:hypothetical protein [Dasineura jujubifolia toursvirus 2a]
MNVRDTEIKINDIIRQYNKKDILVSKFIFFNDLQKLCLNKLNFCDMLSENIKIIIIPVCIKLYSWSHMILIILNIKSFEVVQTMYFDNGLDVCNYSYILDHIYKYLYNKKINYNNELTFLYLDKNFHMYRDSECVLQCLDILKQYLDKNLNLY